VGGSDWLGIKWIQFELGPDGGGPITWIDNLIFQVPTGLPAPGTLSLVGAALVGVVTTRRRKPN